MSKPVVAIVGRPNVGKSTFFNYIVGKRISIVEDTPGVTRDRIYADANWRGMDFTVIDTGGIEPESEDLIVSQMRNQADIAISMADVIVFVTDIKRGITNADNEIALMLRKSKKPIVLVCNKADNFGKTSDDIYEFYNLGLGDPHPVSSINALGIGDVLDAIYEKLPKNDNEEDDSTVIKVALIGKPNVGKSSLVNKILGENRVIVSNIAGTTRDAIDSEFENSYGKYVFIDTAGIRNTTDEIEKIGVEKSKKIVDDAELIIAIFDGSHALENEDYEILDLIKEKNAILLINKIDIVDGNVIANELKKYNNNIIRISAKTGIGVDELYSKISEMYKINDIELDDGEIVTNIRHKGQIDEAIRSLNEVKNTIKNHMPIDITEIYLKQVLADLEKITGDDISEDIINEIFSKFCLGK